MNALCAPPSFCQARTTSAAISGVHLGCRAAANHPGSSVFVVSALVVIVRSLWRLSPFCATWAGAEAYAASYAAPDAFETARQQAHATCAELVRKHLPWKLVEAALTTRGGAS
ncbi:hypothetical protein STIAU_1932 [Stigmatella aurantiaca DW4/3-1]|uniref:Uncharacterized protein n=1 Tax=Stigmatella aurantiaca (strain DW4/3-1) TaxID=378806 RepID=Q091V4_STIAD|nr:hypothetical protein STIAU_1932 [Stigmatella aurantiaca DW4/3-1]